MKRTAFVVMLVMQALSNSPVSEASPAMLPDGRILYHRWEYVDKAAGNLKCLWAMNPDGTASSEIYGNTITFPETMIYPRPIPGAPGKIVMLGTSHCCPNNAMGAVIVIDTSQELRSEDTMQFVTNDIRAYAHTGFHFQDDQGLWQLDKTGTLGRLFKDPTRQAYADALLRTHPDLRLSDVELRTITNWLDLNCPFHPSYWGRLHAKFRGHPNYRPDVTFEEALMRMVPASISRAESKAAHMLAAPNSEPSAMMINGP